MSGKMDDRLSLYECIRDKISDYFMKQSYTASSDLMSIFGSILGDKMLWNLLIKGLFHHLHYIPKIQLNLINEQLSSRISELQHKQIQQRELALEIKNLYNKSIMNGNKKKLKGLNHDDKDSDDSDISNKSISKSKSKNKQTQKMPNSTQLKNATLLLSENFSTLRYVNNLSDDMWIKIFQYLDLYSILKCERTCHYFCRVTSNNPACFTNFKYSFCPSNRSYMFRHYQRLNGINDPFYRFRHSTKVHLSFWSKENYEFRLLTAFGDRFRNVRSLTIEVNRESPLVDLSQLVKKYSNFFVSIRSVVICVHGLGQPHPNPHNRMITLYKSLISFILIRCSFIRTLTLNYSLLTQCYRHVSSCLELTQILCINSKSQLFNDHKQIQDDDYSNIIIFKMNNSVNDIVNDTTGDKNDNTNIDVNDTNNHHINNNDRHHRGRHSHRSRHHSHSHRNNKIMNRINDDNKTTDDLDDNKMKIIKLGNIETQIQREIKIIFYRRHVRYSFLSYFHNHIRSIHVHNSMGFSNDIESPESRRLNLDTTFGEYEFLEELCLYNVSNKITTFVNSHCRNCPMLNKMNIIFDCNKNVYNADQLYKTIKVLLFNSDNNNNGKHQFRFNIGNGESNDNSLNNNDTITYGLDEEEQKIEADISDENDINNINNNNEYMSHHLHGYGLRRGLIPKLMRKYLNIITLNCDISANVKLLSNLEKTFEIISNNLGISTNDNNNVNSLLLQLNLFVHIHIDVECNNTDEIKKLLQLLKHKYFQCDYTSYHVIARKINSVSTQKNAKQEINSTKMKSPRGIKKSMSAFSANAKSKFLFNNNNNNNNIPITEQKQQSIMVSHANISAPVNNNVIISNEKESNSAASTPRTANSDNINIDKLSSDNNLLYSNKLINNDENGPTLISPSILHRNTGVGIGEIDDGNKSDGGSNSNSGTGINFKDAMTKMKLFGNSVKKLIKSNTDPSRNDNNNHNNNQNDELKINDYNNNNNNNQRRQPNNSHFHHHSPNQILRFMKKATIHCDDVKWICDCKYAQCSTKYRTLYNDNTSNKRQ